jgi:hypothetical protein
MACAVYTSQAQTADTTISATLVSKAPDATSMTYLWTKVSGPSAGTISSPTSLTTNLTGLSVGVYVFQIVGTDNFGVSSVPKQKKVTVLRPGVLPVMDAGPDIIIQAK